MVISFLIPARIYIALLTSILWVSAAADTHTELKNLTRRIARITQELNKLHTSEASIEQSLAQTEQSIGKAVLALQHLKQQIQQVEQRHQKLQRSLSRHRKHLEQQRARLADQLRINYILGRKAPLQFIMNLDDPTTISRTLTYHRYLHQARLARIRETQQQLQKIHSLNLEIEQNENRLTALMKQQRKELEHLKDLRRDRKKVLATLKKQMTDKRLRLAKMRKDKQRLTRLLDSVSKASIDWSNPIPARHPFKKQKGRFHWPVSGRIKVRYGAPRGMGRWEGMIISAPEGSPVRAIHPGKVIFSDWLRGYGQLIILRHDRDFMTLYAFNQSLLKQVGDRVKTGETIATVGDTGGQDGPGVYFAIRYRGEPVDPLRWCRRPRKNRVN